jgi:hypothetical protein
VAKSVWVSDLLAKGRGSGLPLMCWGRVGWKMQLRVLWFGVLSFQVLAKAVCQFWGMVVWVWELGRPGGEMCVARPCDGQFELMVVAWLLRFHTSRILTM